MGFVKAEECVKGKSLHSWTVLTIGYHLCKPVSRHAPCTTTEVGLILYSCSKGFFLNHKGIILEMYWLYSFIKMT